MKRIIAQFRNYIITGLIVVFPLFTTLAILWWIFIKLTNISFRFIPPERIAHPGWNIGVRIIVPLVIVFILAVIGMITRVVFVRNLFGLGEKLLVKIPLFNKIYIALKQLSYAFLSGEKTVFKKVVLLEYPRRGLYSIGFITSYKKDLFNKTLKGDVVSVFVPTTPNPTSGVLVYAHLDQIKELDLTVEEGLKLVISGGTVYPDELPAGISTKNRWRI